MVLWIEKKPISIIGVGYTPIPIYNMYANRVVDKDTSRIVKLSTIGGELNTIQHFGHNSRSLQINGTINLVSQSVWGIYSIDAILTGIRLLKETKSAVLVILNHGFLYGVIEEFDIIDEAEGATIFKYELSIVEKDFFGVRFSAIAQRVLTGITSSFISGIGELANPVRGDEIVPQLIDT